jgi:hypothetical protein
MTEKPRVFNLNVKLIMWSLSIALGSPLALIGISKLPSWYRLQSAKSALLEDNLQANTRLNKLHDLMVNHAEAGSVLLEAIPHLQEHLHKPILIDHNNGITEYGKMLTIWLSYSKSNQNEIVAIRSNGDFSPFRQSNESSNSFSSFSSVERFMLNNPVDLKNLDLDLTIRISVVLYFVNTHNFAWDSDIVGKDLEFEKDLKLINEILRVNQMPPANIKMLKDRQLLITHIAKELRFDETNSPIGIYDIIEQISSVLMNRRDLSINLTPKKQKEAKDEKDLVQKRASFILKHIQKKLLTNPNIDSLIIKLWNEELKQAKYVNKSGVKVLKFVGDISFNLADSDDEFEKDLLSELSLKSFSDILFYKYLDDLIESSCKTSLKKYLFYHYLLEGKHIENPSDNKIITSSNLNQGFKDKSYQVQLDIISDLIGRVKQFN